jgi:hypothetical protein
MDGVEDLIFNNVNGFAVLGSGAYSDITGYNDGD